MMLTCGFVRVVASVLTTGLTAVDPYRTTGFGKVEQSIGVGAACAIPALPSTAMPASAATVQTMVFFIGKSLLLGPTTAASRSQPSLIPCGVTLIRRRALPREQSVTSALPSNEKSAAEARLTFPEPRTRARKGALARPTPPRTFAREVG